MIFRTPSELELEWKEHRSLCPTMCHSVQNPTSWERFVPSTLRLSTKLPTSPLWRNNV